MISPVRRLLGMVIAVSVFAMILGVLAAGSAATPGVPSGLDAGQRRSLNSTGFNSPSGRFELFLFTDGGMELDEVVHLASQPPGALAQFTAWDGVRQDINRHCDHGYLIMQTNGNLVMYCRAGAPIWSTHTAGTGAHNYFRVQDNGNLVVYNGAGHAVWAAGSTAPMITTGQHLDPGRQLRVLAYSDHAFVSLTMQRAGDLVLTYGSRVAWRSGTHTPGSRLVLFPGGNLVIQGPHGRTIWSTHTAGIGAGTTLAVFDNGRIAEAALTGPHGNIRWSRSG